MYRSSLRPSLLKRPAESSSSDKLAKISRLTDQNFKSEPVTERKPLDSISNKVSATDHFDVSNSAATSLDLCYFVLWRKFTTKKNKTWDGDGILEIVNGQATLLDVGGRELGRTAWKTPLLPGTTLTIGGRDVEVDSLMSQAEVLVRKSVLQKVVKPVAPEKRLIKDADSATTKPKQQVVLDNSEPAKSVGVTKTATAPFKNPCVGRLKKSSLGVNKKVPIPKHDPIALGALVMPRPASVPKGKQVVDVVVDPVLSRHLREHQREGVRFLYECVMGMRLATGQGCILADEMGLGKTLQTITLIWTLLKQNPVFEDAPVVKKALIVCPVTLVNNWRMEFKKWLGNDRIGVFVADNKHNRLSYFTKGTSYNVMIVGYEKLRTLQDQLCQGAGIDLIVADEGHRLKTAKNKAAMAINTLNAAKRIVLTGTPMQNDLSEFYIMADLVNPGALGKYNKFRKDYEGPIIRGRQPEASEAEKDKGQACSDELAAVTCQFILRRTSDVIAKYLPPKTEIVLFCCPTKVQASIYRAVLASPSFNSILGSSEASLQLINALKKLCNSPSLLLKKLAGGATDQRIAALLESIPESLSKAGPGSSTKIQLLDSLLHHLSQEKREKVVIVSNYTSTLDLIQRLLTSLGYTHLRLDGSTSAGKRQGLVNQFNQSSPDKCFAFLLSAKAGGIGLNLVGASRLVLFDVDWNPATDLQAMARIHRDGQKKPCFVYRLIVQGALDEKIYQRQVMKTGLADAVVDAKKTAQGFTMEELRDLFKLDEGQHCPTHELLGCECGGSGNAHMLSEHEESDEDQQSNPWGSTMADPAADYVEAPDEQVSLSQRSSNFITAAAFTNEEIEQDCHGPQQQQSRGEKAMLALMKYLHIDAARIRNGDAEVESLIEDQVLLRVLKEQECRVAFMFARTTA